MKLMKNDETYEMGLVAVSSKCHTLDCRSQSLIFFSRTKLILSSKNRTTNFSVRNTLLQSAVNISQLKLTMKPGEFLFRTEIDCTDPDIRLGNQL